MRSFAPLHEAIIGVGTLNVERVKDARARIVVREVDGLVSATDGAARSPLLNASAGEAIAGGGISAPAARDAVAAAAGRRAAAPGAYKGKRGCPARVPIYARRSRTDLDAHVGEFKGRRVVDEHASGGSAGRLRRHIVRDEPEMFDTRGEDEVRRGKRHEPLFHNVGCTDLNDGPCVAVPVEVRSVGKAPKDRDAIGDLQSSRKRR